MDGYKKTYLENIGIRTILLGNWQADFRLKLVGINVKKRLFSQVDGGLNGDLIHPISCTV